MAIKLTLHNCLCLLFYAVVHCRSNITRLLLREPLFSVFCFYIYFLMAPCHCTCHRVSLHTLLLAHSVPVQMIKLFLAQAGILRALVTCRSLFKRPACLEQPSWSHPTLQFFHISKIFFDTVSLLRPTLSYSNPLTGIGCCT